MTLHNILQFAEIADTAENNLPLAGNADSTTGAGTLLERFQSQFDVLPANTLERVRIAQRIRYQVYCVEHSHEKADDPDGEEMDEFDSHAAQSLLIHRAAKTPLGTVRLILPRPDALHRSFAVQRVMDAAALSEFQKFPLQTTGEVSRFSISRQFRRIAGLSNGGADIDLLGSSGPLMRLGLIQALVRMSREHGITHWCAAMEPTLLRMLSAMAIRFRPIGPLVEYHGLRQPAYCVLADVLKAVRDERPAFWSILTEDGARIH
ncbi:MAG TPA: PEP-CTERM/exosortase system-associated acyltransferase [Micropepsaceae bacterium]|jgi:N-acyl amino acid synthase of PEP-CTERM/exosortase system